MRASDGEHHLAGAERLVAGEEVAEVTAGLARRALNAAGGESVEIVCNIEKVDTADIHYATLPCLHPYNVKDYHEGRQLAKRLLEETGVANNVATEALNMLTAGPGPNKTVMRGAVILDVHMGERMERNPARGVRVTRMDLTAECHAKQSEVLAKAGLKHRRVIEALTLSGKVLSCPGIVAELCWSDDPEYTAGYVASPAKGYRRISELKPAGQAIGGRIFFVDFGNVELSEVVNYLEKKSVLFNQPGRVFPETIWSPEDA